MQNWENLDAVLSAVNKQPTTIDVDINRVCNRFLEGKARAHRQTLIFADKNFLELHVLLNEHDENQRGTSTFIQPPQSVLKEVRAPFFIFSC